MRVDDFPHPKVNLNDFKKFDSLMKKFNVPYLLGVIPRPCLDPLNPKSTDFRKLSKEEIKALRYLKDVELAMHGVTHKTREYGLLKRLLGFRSEFVGLDKATLTKKLQIGLSLFREYGLKRPRVFIPPFNTFDHASLAVLGSHFDVICGDPETSNKFGREWRRFGKVLYIPSLPPHYGPAREIKITQDTRACITIHLGWERRDHFQALGELLGKLEGKVVSWGVLK